MRCSSRQQRVNKIGRPIGHRRPEHLRGPGHGLREELRLLRRWCAPTWRCCARCRASSTPRPSTSSAVGRRQLDQFYSLPDKKGEKSPVAYYNTDEHGVKTLGVKLAGGTNFDRHRGRIPAEGRTGFPGTAVVTRALRRSAVPQGQRPAGGQDLLRRPEQAARDRRRHRAHAWRLGGLGQARPRDAEPLVGPGPGMRYLVRTEPGQARSRHGRSRSRAAQARSEPRRRQAAHDAELKQSSYAERFARWPSPSRWSPASCWSFSALGIFGLATFNVNTRTQADRHAAGGRRAQARHRALLHGRELDGHHAGRGGGLRPGAGRRASGCRTEYGLPRLRPLLPRGRACWASGLVGQLAAWQPALRAAKVSPAMATRSV